MNEPRWIDIPDQPGLWLLDCVTQKGNLRWSAMWLDQGDLDRGAPFGTTRVYGPVSLPPEEKEPQ